MAHSNLYHPLDLGVLVCQIQAVLAFLANLVVQYDPWDLVDLAVLAGHFGLAYLALANLVNQVVPPHQVIQLVLALLEALYLLVVLVAPVPHSIQVFQSQVILWVQQALGVLEDLYDQAVLAVPSPCLLLALVILEVQEDLCVLDPPWTQVDLVILERLVCLFQVTQVAPGDPVDLAVQVAHFHPLGPFLPVVQLHHCLLVCRVVLAILVFQVQGLLVDQKVQVFPKVLAVQFLGVQEVLQVLLALVAQQDLALLGESPLLL